MLKNFLLCFVGPTLSDIKSLENWNVSNGFDFNNIFQGLSLKDIQPLQKWNVSNGINFKGIFCYCSILTD